MSDEDKYVETQLESGGIIIEFVSPPQPPIYKTRGLSRTEYIKLFSKKEQALFFRFMDNIDGDLSFMPVGQVSLSDPVGLPSDEDYDPNFTYHDAMRIGKSGFTLAPATNGFDMDSESVIDGLLVMDLLGMLDDNTRRATILKGKLL